MIQFRNTYFKKLQPHLIKNHYLLASLKKKQTNLPKLVSVEKPETLVLILLFECITALCFGKVDLIIFFLNLYTCYFSHVTIHLSVKVFLIVAFILFRSLLGFQWVPLLPVFWWKTCLSLMDTAAAG